MYSSIDDQSLHVTFIDSQFVQNFEIWLGFCCERGIFLNLSSFRENVGRYLMETNREAMYHNCQIN